MKKVLSRHLKYYLHYLAKQPCLVLSCRQSGLCSVGCYEMGAVPGAGCFHSRGAPHLVAGVTVLSSLCNPKQSFQRSFL